jgi:putative transport protein
MSTNLNILILFFILTIGTGLGKVRIRGFSLGPSGVLLVALIFGHFNYKVSPELLDLGILLFVYNSGLQAGPRFFRTFTYTGRNFILLGCLPVIFAFVTTLIIYYCFDLPKDLLVGIFSGALTDTTAMASSIDTFERNNNLVLLSNSLKQESSSNISIGYTMTYPLSMLSLVLLMQILPRIKRFNILEEESKWLEQKALVEPPILIKQFKVTNPNCHLKSVRNLIPFTDRQVTFSHIYREKNTIPINPELKLQLGDIVTVVAKDNDLENMKVLLGEIVDIPLEIGRNISVRDIEVSEATITNKSLSDLKFYQNYKVLVTKIKRQGVEIVPRGNSILDFGDYIRVIGESADVEEFEKLINSKNSKVNEVSMLPFLIGILLGGVIGLIPISITPLGIEIRLGLSGGAFLVSLIIGHFGKFRSISFYVPPAAKNLCRELGLILFLAAAGTHAGSEFTAIFLSQQGLVVVASGLAITLTCLISSLLISLWVLKANLLSTIGMVCGCMSNSSGLSVAREKSDSDLSNISYASVYPIALIMKIIMAQILLAIFRFIP